MGTGTVDLGSAPALAWVTILLDASIKGAVILLIAGALSGLLRRTSAAARHLVWLLAVASLIALPVLSLALPAWRLPILPQELAAVEPVTTPMTETGAPPEALSQLAIPPEPVAVTPLVSIAESLPEPEPPAPTHWSAWLLIIWGTGATAVFLWLLAGTVSVWRMARRARPVPEGSSWAVLLKELAGRLGVKSVARLLQSEGVSVPMIWGLVRPVVLLPADGERWSEERRRIVLLHELAHIRRKDCLTQMVAQLACTIYWFNPLAWLAARQMRRERERACDDLVLAAGLKASNYAGHLLEIARSARSLRWAAIAGVAMARPSNIEGRLLAILDARRSRRALTRLTFALALIAVTCALLPLAAIRPVATAAGEDSGTQDQRFERRLYDIRDLLRRPGEGELTAEQLKENGEQFAGSLKWMFETDFAALWPDEGTGEPAPLPTIAYREGNLDVRGTPAQHQRIADSLESMRTNRRFSVELDVQAVVIDRAALPAEHRELLSRGAPEAVVKALLEAEFTDFKDLALNIPDIKLVGTARVAKTGWLHLQPAVASSVKWQRKAHVARSQGPPTPIDGLLGTTVSTGVLTVKDAYVDLQVKHHPVTLLNLPATVPDGGILVGLEEGATARAGAAVWMGEEAAKRLNIEDCIVVLLARPHIIAQQELHVALPHSVPSKLGLEGRVHLRGELQVGGPTARPPIARQLGPWKKQLANGAVVEILAAGRIIDDRLQWWTPEGSRRSLPRVFAADVEGAGTVLAVRIEGSSDLTCKAQVVERSRSTKVEGWYSGHDRVWLLALGERRFVNLKLLVSSGPWNVRLKIPVTAEDVGRDISGAPESGVERVFNLASLPEGGFKVSVRYNNLRSGRFFAEDRAGTVHSDVAGSFVGEWAALKFGFPLQELSALVWRDRPTESVEFRNLRIAPPTWLEPAKVVSPVQRGGTAPRSASQPVHAADPALGSRGAEQEAVAAKSERTPGTEAAAEIHVRLYEFSGPFPKQVTQDLGLAPAEGGTTATPLTGAKLRILVDALKALPDVKLVWSPKLTLYDTRRAQIASPTHENFVKDVRRVTKDGEERIEPVIETLTWGRLLDARPTISSDRRFVEVEFGFTDSRLERFDTEEKLGHRIQVPVLETTELKTTVNIPNGGAVALSGLRLGERSLLLVVSVDVVEPPVVPEVGKPAALPGAPVGEVRKAFIPDDASAEKSICRKNLMQIGLAFMMYLSSHDQEFPQSLDDLVRYLEGREALVCPGSGEEGYVYEKPPTRFLQIAAPSFVAIVYDKAGNHEGGRNVLFLDAHVEWLTEGDFQKLRRFVRLVVGKDRMTFEGQETTWQQLPVLLEKVRDRRHTVLELAVASEEMTLKEKNQAQGRASSLSRQLGFQYLSYFGVLPVGSKGTPPARPRPQADTEQARREKLQRKITFSFVDTPLEDVADFIRRVGDVSMVVDQRVLATVGPGGYRITLSLTDVPLADALDFITDLVDLKWTVRRGTVFISDAQGLQAGAEERKALEERRKARAEMIARDKVLGEKLQRSVTFSFADTPLEDVADFLRRVGDVSMVVDQRVLAAAGPGGYRITLSLTDIPLEDALDFIVDLLDLEWTIRRGGVFISDALGVQAEPEAEEKEALEERRKARAEMFARDKVLGEKLRRKIAFSFDDTPLEDVADFLRRVGDVNIVVDQRVLATVGPGGYRVSLDMTDVPLEDALDFILDLVDLDWVIRRGVVFISDVQGVQAEAFMRIYDVRDIIGQVPDFAGPGFDVEAPGPPRRAEADEAELKAAEEKGDALAALIQENVARDSWGLGGQNSIVYRDGSLIVRNTTEVHEEIQQLLKERRQSSLFSLRPVTEPGKSYAEKMVDLRTDQEVWLSKTCIVSAASLVPKPEVSVRLQPGLPAAIEVEITADAASRLAQWTKAHVRQQMAVVCDGEVWSVATVAEPIASEKMSIAAPDAERAQRFATKLQEYFDRRLKEGRRSP